MLLIGTTLTALSLSTGNTAMLPLFIILPLTFALNASTKYLGWEDDRTVSPVRYFASKGVLASGVAALLLSVFL